MHEQNDYEDQGDPAPFRCLGHDKNVFYYHSLAFSPGAIALTPAQHNESQLRAMASSNGSWYSYVDPTEIRSRLQGMAAEKDAASSATWWAYSIRAG